MLRNASDRTLEVRIELNSHLLVQSHIGIQTTLFGKKLPSPIILAPIGVQGTFNAEGEFPAARAAQKLGIPFTLSTAASRTIEEVAEANGDGHRWFQLYWYVVYCRRGNRRPLISTQASLRRRHSIPPEAR